MEKCLVLDFDDTLVKTIDTHAASWKHALDRVLKIDVPIETIMADINFGMDVLLRKFQLTQEEQDLAKKYKKEIFEKNLHKTRVNKLLLYIIENNLFEDYVIASNSSRENLDKIMAYHGIDEKLFYRIFTRDDVKNKKPHIEMGNKIIDAFSGLYEPKDFLMVGDSNVDKLFSQKLGIKCILIKC